MPAVEISAQSVELGFPRGVLRKSADVAAFSISRSPITLGEFRKCVGSGACEEPGESHCVAQMGASVVARPNYDEDAPEDRVAACVGVENARKFCSWAGSGRLPSLEEWMLAARGGSPQLYPWGSAPATCDQHPLAAPDQFKRCDHKTEDLGRVGLFTAGASPLGLQDVLLTSGELLERSDGAFFGACLKDHGDAGAPVSAASKAGEDPACIVYGTDPGAIDSVESVGAEEATATPYGFRCVWGGAP